MKKPSTPKSVAETEYEESHDETRPSSPTALAEQVSSVVGSISLNPGIHSASAETASFGFARRYVAVSPSSSKMSSQRRAASLRDEAVKQMQQQFSYAARSETASHKSFLIDPAELQQLVSERTQLLEQVNSASKRESVLTCKLLERQHENMQLKEILKKMSKKGKQPSNPAATSVMCLDGPVSLPSLRTVIGCC